MVTEMQDAAMRAGARGATRATGLTGPQKAAAVLLALPRDKAARIMAGLGAAELERLTREIATLRQIPPAELQAVIEEFRAAATSASHQVAGGIDLARDLLRAVGPAGENLVDRVSASMGDGPFAFLQQRTPEDVLQQLRLENVQTIAMVLSHLPSRFGAQLLAGFEEARRGDIAHRIATMGPTPPDVLARVERAVASRFGPPPPTVAGASGVEELANLLNEMDKQTEQSVMAALEASDPAVAEQVRALMFVFEDVVELDARQLQEVLRGVDASTLALALKGVEESVVETIRGNLSERARTALDEEAELLGPTPRSEVEAAHAEIVDVVRRMEADGTITIHRGGTEDLL